MSRERIKYAIRATNRPAKNSVLSTTVVVSNEDGGAGYCYINFSESFVEAVGAALPRGVSEQDPAFVSVTFYAPTKVWLVTASYLSGGGQTLLWKTHQRPAWLNFYPVSLSHGNTYPPKRQRGRPRKASCDDSRRRPQESRSVSGAQTALA